MIPLLKEESMEKEHVEHHLGHPGDSVEQHSVQVSFFRSGQFRSFQVSSGQVPDVQVSSVQVNLTLSSGP